MAFQTFPPRLLPSSWLVLVTSLLHFITVYGIDVFIAPATTFSSLPEGYQFTLWTSLVHLFPTETPFLTPQRSYAYLRAYCIATTFYDTIHIIYMQHNVSLTVLSAVTHIITLNWRCPWCNGYRRKKWTRQHEFKS